MKSLREWATWIKEGFYAPRAIFIAAQEAEGKMEMKTLRDWAVQLHQAILHDNPDDTMATVLKRLESVVSECQAEARATGKAEGRREVLEHIGHGSGSPCYGPDDPDCACRTSTKQQTCALAGCGFCVCIKECTADCCGARQGFPQ